MTNQIVVHTFTPLLASFGRVLSPIVRHSRCFGIPSLTPICPLIAIVCWPRLSPPTTDDVEIVRELSSVRPSRLGQQAVASGFFKKSDFIFQGAYHTEADIFYCAHAGSVC